MAARFAGWPKCWTTITAPLRGLTTQQSQVLSYGFRRVVTGFASGLAGAAF
jgi:hypothetical protein